MALTIPSVPDPARPSRPATDAYGWIRAVNLDTGTGEGRLVVQINADAASWQGAPLKTIERTLGQVVAGEGGPVAFPTLAGLMGNPQFAAAWATITGILYAALLADPELAGATLES